MPAVKSKRPFSRFVASLVPVLLIVLLAHPQPTAAARRCARAIGRVTCPLGFFIDPDVALVEMWDRDGFLGVTALDPLNPDDLMGRAPIEKDGPRSGRFEVHGCAEDDDWLWLENEPEPFLKLKHVCKMARVAHHYDTEVAEIIDVRVFRIFTPNVYEAGTIEAK